MTQTDAISSKNRLKITEVFCSLQGEALTSGVPTVFVRLTGCPLRCRYCDTAYAFHGGTWNSIDHLVHRVLDFGLQHVCVTGGEPLAQRRSLDLLHRLCDEGLSVSLETSGAEDISNVDARVSRIVDIKTPGSGECGRNYWDNLAVLRDNDAVKIVICDEQDYQWAREKIRDQLRDCPCPIFFSPSANELSPGLLGDWLVRDRLPVRLQLQLHKVLWGDVPGR